jgi:hypothetical protein
MLNPKRKYDDDDHLPLAFWLYQSDQLKLDELSLKLLHRFEYEFEFGFTVSTRVLHV